MMLKRNINKYKIGPECERWLGSWWKLNDVQIETLSGLISKANQGRLKDSEKLSLSKLFINTGVPTNANMLGIRSIVTKKIVWIFFSAKTLWLNHFGRDSWLNFGKKSKTMFASISWWIHGNTNKYNKSRSWK